MRTMCGLRSGKISDKSRKVGPEKTSETDGREKFVGDGLTLRMESNERDVEVTGDGCRLTVVENRGRIRINGDGCRLKIEKNAGDIEYRGDGGRVDLGVDATGTKVRYFGEGGRVKIGGACAEKSAGSTRKNREQLVDDDGRGRRVTRTVSKTVRIIYTNPKIASPTVTRSSVEITKSSTVAG